MQTDSIKPIEQGQRTAIVDILRGWALLGVVIMNYIDFARLAPSTAKPHNTDVASTVTYYITSIFFAEKSWTLLSMLFGYGFAVLIGNLQKKGHNPVKFFTGRMFWLFVLAFINSAFFFGDILKDYALMGLLMLFFYRISGKAAFISAIALFVLVLFTYPLIAKYMPYDYVKVVDSIMPLYHSGKLGSTLFFNLKGTWEIEVISPAYAIPIHMTMLACMLLGLSAYRYNIFNCLGYFKRIIKRTCWIALVAATALTLFGIFTAKYQLGYKKYISLFTLTVLCTLAFIASSICLLYIGGKLKKFFSFLGYFGKMTLTNYMVQNVISMFVFSGAGAGIYTTMHPAFYVGLAVVVYILQGFFSKWWLTRYYYGPVEWLWRQLSYRRRLPIKREKDKAVAVLQ